MPKAPQTKIFARFRNIFDIDPEMFLVQKTISAGCVISAVLAALFLITIVKRRPALIRNSRVREYAPSIKKLWEYHR